MWLIGKATSQLSASRLATNGDALRCLLYHHLEQQLTVKESIRNTAQQVIENWSKARIPTQRIDSCERKLKKLYNEYNLLKKNRAEAWESCKIKNQMFQDKLCELFDIATNDAMTTMTIDEDKQFLAMQRADVTSSSMGGIDRQLAEKEARKSDRNKAIADRAVRARNATAKLQQEQSCDISLETSSSSAEETDSEYKTRSSNASKSAPKVKRLRSIVSSSEVAGALDRVNLPDRGAMFVVASVAKALGHPIEDLSLSRSTIRRSRMALRQQVSQAEKDSFMPECPLLLHWDGKLLPDIAGSKETVDRIAVIVTGNGVEKLLAVPKIGTGTGADQAAACLKVLDDWKIRDKIRGLVFDTTSSNIGIHKGACITIEEALGRELVNIGCRHHVLEVILSNAFTAVFGGTGGPEVGLFKRFQKKWPYIRQVEFSAAEDELFDTEMENLRKDMVLFYTEAIRDQQTRDDYRELLQLCLVFLGGSVDACGDVKFRAPGAIHHARWMAKAIYTLKMTLFRNQLTLTGREKNGIMDVSLFVGLIYGRFWHEAPLATNAPLNDSLMLGLLNSYSNRIIADAARSALLRHLWFFSEPLVGLAFFDSRVDFGVKRNMVANLQLPMTALGPKRIRASDVDYCKLESFVTKRTECLFDLLSDTGKDEARLFLSKDPEEWEQDESYQKLKKIAQHIKVVNDTAERGIALMQIYNDSLTRDEEQKQFLLRFVARHRNIYPAASKAAMSMNDS